MSWDILSKANLQYLLTRLKVVTDSITRGHGIKDDSGTSMNVRSNVQFQGTYVSDDSTNDKTVVPIVRTMTKSQFNQLSSAGKKGFIDVTDEEGHPVTSEDIPYKTTSVKAVLDDITNDCVGFARNGVYDGNNTLIGTWNSVSDVEAFLSEHEVSTGKFTGLKVGQRIKINDGTYNKEWFIAGFDCDYKLGTASSSPYYVSSHHICLIPVNTLTNGKINNSLTVSGGYKSSLMYTTTLPAIITALETILSTHLLEQCLAISTSVSSGKTQMTENAKAKMSLLTECQVIGSVVWGNYRDQDWHTMKLPLFNFQHSAIAVNSQITSYWLRSVASDSSWSTIGLGKIESTAVTDSIGIRPYIIVG